MEEKNQENLSNQESKEDSLNSDKQPESSLENIPKELDLKQLELEITDNVINTVQESIIHIIEERREELFVGPIPHPQTLKGYEDVIKGSGDRIIAMAERQQEHRMYMQKTLVNNDFKRSNLGLIAGFTIALVGLGGSIYLGAIGRNVASGIMGTATLGGLVTVFVKGANANSEEKNTP